MKQILLFGAGKSATVLIDYLLKQCAQNNWQLAVADANLQLAKSKINSHPNGNAYSFDINDASTRLSFITQSSLVISLLPPAPAHPRGSGLPCCRQTPPYSLLHRPGNGSIRPRNRK